MKLPCICAVLIIWAGVAPAQTPPQQAPAYAGTWVSQKDKDIKLTLETTGDKIHVQEYKGSELKFDYTCGITGSSCKFKDGGHSATVSLWLNGPKLVELQTTAESVTKRRFSVTDKGSTLDVEVLKISPPGETEKIAFSRD